MRLSNHHGLAPPLLPAEPQWPRNPPAIGGSEDGSAIIRIDNCGGALWGVVAWETGARAAIRRSGRPTLGSPVLINMRASSQARWDGQIYNAQNGETYQGQCQHGRRQHASRRGMRHGRHVLRRSAVDAGRRRATTPAAAPERRLLARLQLSRDLVVRFNIRYPLPRATKRMSDPKSTSTILASGPLILTFALAAETMLPDRTAQRQIQASH